MHLACKKDMVDSRFTTVCLLVFDAAGGPSMTIAIVAKSIRHKCFVSISDRMISFEDEVPAIDNAVFKDLPIRFPNWNMVFAANNPDFVGPIWQAAVASLAKTSYQPSLTQVEDAVCNAYTDVLHKYVTRQYLTKFGFKTIDEFRKAGASQLGRRFFGSVTRKIDGFDAGVEFLVYGFDHAAHKNAHMFKVGSPGNVTLNFMRSVLVPEWQ
jgi:hypothetical protein